MKHEYTVCYDLFWLFRHAVKCSEKSGNEIACRAIDKADEKKLKKCEFPLRAHSANKNKGIAIRCNKYQSEKIEKIAEKRQDRELPFHSLNSVFEEMLSCRLLDKRFAWNLKDVAATGYEAPLEPAGLSVKLNSAREAEVRWNHSIGAARYRITHTDPLGKTREVDGDHDLNYITYGLTLTPGKHSFWVYAWNGFSTAPNFSQPAQYDLEIYLTAEGLAQFRGSIGQPLKPRPAPSRKKAS